MDLIAPLLIDPATPRLTTYTDAGRMELSGITLANWQSKVANLLTSVGVSAGDTIAVSAVPGWQPAVIAIGAWRVGAAVVDASPSSDNDATSPLPKILFTDSLDLAENFEDTERGAEVEETYLLSSDPFGRGVEESGGDVPFGINDFSPELRVQPDAFVGPEPTDETADLEELQGYATELALTAGIRVLTGAWNDVAGLKRCLSPLVVGGSVVVTTDDSSERLISLSDSEKTGVTVA